IALSGLDEHVAETLCRHRLQEYVTAATLHDKGSPAASRIVEVSADDLVHLVLEYKPGSYAGGRLYRGDLILSKSERDNRSLRTGSPRERKQNQKEIRER